MKKAVIGYFAFGMMCFAILGGSLYWGFVPNGPLLPFWGALILTSMLVSFAMVPSIVRVRVKALGAEAEIERTAKQVQATADELTVKMNRFNEMTESFLKMNMSAIEPRGFEAGPQYKRMETFLLEAKKLQALLPNGGTLDNLIGSTKAALIKSYQEGLNVFPEMQDRNKDFIQIGYTTLNGTITGVDEKLIAVDFVKMRSLRTDINEGQRAQWDRYVDHMESFIKKYVYEEP